MSSTRLRTFTLVELVAVLVIIALTTTIAVTSFRGESDVRKLERGADEFLSFCARVRYQAMESGSDRTISYDPDSACFRMTVPRFSNDSASGDVFSDDASSASGGSDDFGELVWSLPDGMELDARRGTLDAFGEYELFRFFPDGGGSGTNELVFALGKLAARIRISELTGMLRVSAEEAL